MKTRLHASTILSSEWRAETRNHLWHYSLAERRDQTERLFKHMWNGVDESHMIEGKIIK